MSWGKDNPPGGPVVIATGGGSGGGGTGAVGGAAAMGGRAGGGAVRTWCCHTLMSGPHADGCGFDPTVHVDYAGPVRVVPPVAPHLQAQIGPEGLSDWKAQQRARIGGAVLPHFPMESTEPGVGAPRTIVRCSCTAYFLTEDGEDASHVRAAWAAHLTAVLVP